MPERTIRIRAPSRLHFGMLSFGEPAVRQFGGVGVMTELPGLELLIGPSRQLELCGPHSARVGQFARLWARHRGRTALPGCRLEVLRAPRQHIGLGTGTQLALSVAAGLDAFFGLPTASACDLAESVGRGQRSAVGTYGFLHGGLIAELGKFPDQPLAPMEQRIALPAQWHYVLILPAQEQGLSGQAEQDAFAAMTPVSPGVREQLIAELTERLLPSARAGRFDDYSESTYRYGMMAGHCFAQRQSGAFATDQLADWVQMLRAMGIRGAGQSSWGPTLFALLASRSDADAAAHDIDRRIKTPKVQFVVTGMNNTGAAVVGGSPDPPICDTATHRDSP